MKIKFLKVLLSSCALLACVNLLHAQNHPFQAALWAPDIQLVPATEDIVGVRLEIYGENRNVTGLDIGLINVTTGDFSGVAGAVYVVPTLFNRVDGVTTGWQMGAVNVTGGRVTGWQGGLASINRSEVIGLNTSIINWSMPSTSSLRGVQIAFLNVTGPVSGVQIGLVNYATSLRGIQIGLWNEVASRGYGDFSPLPRVFPIINIGF